MLAEEHLSKLTVDEASVEKVGFSLAKFKRHRGSLACSVRAAFYRFDECISVFNYSVYFTSYLFFHRIA